MNETAPTFSIITVTYNAEATIEVTLHSVQQQTYRQIEHIIVDGGSKDHTLSIIEKYKDSYLHVISEPDKGLYDAMNKGIHLAKGDYLCFLNAGDTFHEVDTLEKIVNGNRELSIVNRQSSILYGQTAIVNADRQFLRMRHHTAPEVLTWKSFKQGMLVCHQAFFVKRTLAEPYNLHYKYSSDFDWCIRMMKKADVITNTHLILIDYLDEGMTTRHHKASLLERLRIMAKHYGWFTAILMHLWFIVRLMKKS
ncbi:MAG: glycosyltransferase [Bacteroidaceae bacterium]|nr:glycosyltransferase [Bacteroidaceae bacterium]